MKGKFLLSIMVLVVEGSTLLAQEYAVDKKATIISGSASFSNQRGSMYRAGKNSTSIIFAPNVNHFVLKNFFIGSGLEFSSDKQSDYRSTAIAIGPQIGYAYGNSNGSVFPYVDLGIRYYNLKQFYGRNMGELKMSGSQITFGFGAIVPLKKHIGIIFEGGYQMVDLEIKNFENDTSWRIFSIGIGIAGLIFKDVN